MKPYCIGFLHASEALEVGQAELDPVRGRLLEYQLYLLHLPVCGELGWRWANSEYTRREGVGRVRWSSNRQASADCECSTELRNGLGAVGRET